MLAFFVTRFTIRTKLSIHHYDIKQLKKLEWSNLLSIYKTILFIHTYNIKFKITVSKNLGIQSGMIKIVVIKAYCFFNFENNCYIKQYYLYIPTNIAFKITLSKNLGIHSGMIKIIVIKALLRF